MSFFNKNEILNVFNLYNYHCGLEIFKILKFRMPIALFSCLKLSKRKNTLLITPQPSHHFVYLASRLWNTIRIKLKITDDFAVNLSLVKKNLKRHILSRQSLGDMIDLADVNLEIYII